MAIECSQNPDRHISAGGVRNAAQRLSGRAMRTPLIENDILNQAVGGRVLVKAEVLQHCGSFKFRGAYNAMAQFGERARANGVLAWSSGNHAQAVALAARDFGARALLIMPTDAPEIKIEKVRALGAEIICYDRYSEDREEIAEAILKDKTLLLIPSFDHPDIIEGQGTTALEIIEDARSAGVEIDAFIACCGGGGLAAGCALIFAEASPNTQIYIAEPEGFDETWRSICAGERLSADISRRTICDAIATRSPGRLTFPILQRHVAAGAAVCDDEVRRAMAFAFKYLKLVVEPGGAAALAALLAGKVDGRGKTTAVTLSGGNVDPRIFIDALAAAAKD